VRRVPLFQNIMSGRRRSFSFGIHADAGTTPSWDALEATQQVWELVCLAMEDPLTKQTLLHSSCNVCLIKTLLDRAHQLDHFTNNSHSAAPNKSISNNNNNHHQAVLKSSQWLSSMLRQGDGESGYTPLHRAVLKSELPIILLLLHYTVAIASNNNNRDEAWTCVLSQRLMHRPLAFLQGEVPTLPEEVRTVLQTTDREGLTAYRLMEKLQIQELEKCRKSLVYSPLEGLLLMDHNGVGATGNNNNNNYNNRTRHHSFEAMLQQDHEQQLGQQNEFADLHNYTQQEQERRRQPSLLGPPNNNTEDNGHISYACEVLAFGRTNHLALGVQGGKNYEEKGTNMASSSSSDPNTTYRPHRVQEFAQDRVGREGSAVAVAAAAHHTLVATRQGHLFAFGVGTGGRLGLGDNERHCPTPTRVLGALEKLRVVAIAAAENHSLCVTSEGAVYAFGSNRFGQLGYSNGVADDSKCCSPRRVEDLWKKHILCISVAAGEKHSVALTQKGEVYVWGCNASGQLGINHHRSNSGTGQRVQRVEALWNNDKMRVCFQVAASSQATLALVKPSPGGLPVNQIFAWGHGNYVPSRVHFSGPEEAQQRTIKKENVFLAAGSGGRRSINPVAIACARHHSAAVTSDGRVYTWGFHADSLGGAGSSSKTPKQAAKNSHSRPQLVTGMLTEEGGGLAVSVSASENHTAVVTNEGSLFTWGESYGKGLMGHEGVRWQPRPKRVAGVCRVVCVSAAKEHTVLLMGASFPCPASGSYSSGPMSLEQVTAHEVAKHIDLFNVVPILMTAERTNCRFLIEHCKEFIRLNIDGVLNVGQKSTMELYLKEQVASGLLLLDEDPRDRRERPLILDITLATYRGRKGLLESETIPSNPVEWIQTCHNLMKKNESFSALLHRMRKEAQSRPVVFANPKCFKRRSSSSVGSKSEAYNEKGGKTRSGSIASESEKDRKMSSSERCIMLTTNMDLSTRELVQTKYDCLTREVRGLKKRLSQIAKLEALNDPEEPDDPTVLSADQRDKISRRPQLESELCMFERALERVDRRTLHYNLKLKRPVSSFGCDDGKSNALPQQPERLDEVKGLHHKAPVGASHIEAIVDPACLRCGVCKITCPDEKSLALHMNGRKHRNRVAQDAEEETQRAAVSMMEQRHRQQMQDMKNYTESGRAKPPIISAWQKNRHLTMSIQSKYKLPPQDNPTNEMVEEQPPKAKSLHQIMEDEAMNSKSQTSAPKGLASSSISLQLTPGSPPPLNPPPWGRKATINPNVATTMPKLPGDSPALKTPPWLQISTGATAALQLPPGSASPLKSPPWATKPLRGSIAVNSPLMPSAAKSKTVKVKSSFGDFLQKAPATPPNNRAGTSCAPWSSSTSSLKGPFMVSNGAVSPSEASPLVSFHAIQQQEVDFKILQDQSYKDNGKWFIERRERAGSLAAIQDEAATKREEQLFIEEQKRIEEQIHREVALQKKKEMKTQRQRANKVKQKLNNGKDANIIKERTASTKSPEEKKAEQNQNDGKEDNSIKRKTSSTQSAEGTNLRNRSNQDEEANKCTNDGGGINKSDGNNRRRTNNRSSGKVQSNTTPIIGDAESAATLFAIN
jgi:alpha-tubulin suppressor-like RCC1 family protein/ferredoxin